MNSAILSRFNYTKILLSKSIQIRYFQQLSSEVTGFHQKPLLLRPIIFTVGVGFGSLVGCSILQYERIKGAVVKNRKKSLTNRSTDKFSDVRQHLNKWWNELHEGRKVAAGIIGINTLVFIAWQLPRYRNVMIKWFTSSINFKVSSPLLLSCFSHSEFWHVGANMFVLWSFSPLIYSMLGTEQFIGFYVAGGTFSSLVSYLYRFATRSNIPSLGASGALLAVLAACCIEHPEARLSILFLPFFTFSAQTALYSIVAVDLTGLLLRWKLFDHAGHLGGTLFGSWYILEGYKYTWEKRAVITNWWHDFHKFLEKNE